MAKTEVMHRQEFGLTILAILAAGASVNFLILGTAGTVPFLEYRNYILFPSLFIILFIAIYGYRKNKRLSNRLVNGLWIGLVATLALEAVRIPSIYVQWIPHDDMIALPGKLLTNPPSIDHFNAMIGHKGVDMGHGDGMKTTSANMDNVSKPLQEDAGHDKHDETKDHMTQPTNTTSTKDHGNESPHSSSQTENESSRMAGHDKEHEDRMMEDSMQASTSELVVGGLYHFWNGATMVAVYSLFLGKARWYFGLVWGFIIHLGMMLAPWMLLMVGPLGINYGPGYTIFTASLIAHLAYGAVLGVLVQRFVREKSSVITLLRQI